jgi:hypothetical protein
MKLRVFSLQMPLRRTSQRLSDGRFQSSLPDGGNYLSALFLGGGGALEDARSIYMAIIERAECIRV